MAKLTLPDVGTLANTESARQGINDNFTAVEAAVENTLSRDGTAPNQMEADLDLNSNKILNVADPLSALDGVNLRTARVVAADAGSGDTAIRFDLATTAVGDGSDLVAYSGSAPAYLQTVSDVLNSQPISLHRFIPRTQHSAIRAGTSVYDAGNDIRTAFLEEDITALLVPDGLHNYSGALPRSNTRLSLRGESSKSSILRCVGAGGLVMNGGAVTDNWRMPTLDLADLWLEAAVANAGTAVTMNYTGGSGFPPLGPTWRDVNITCRNFDEHWNTAVRGTNVRDMHIERVMLAGSFAAPGTWPNTYLMNGFIMDGDDDPVELWFTGLYAYYIGRVIDVGGHYEGIYVDSMHTVGCQHGIRWVAAVPNPVIMVNDSYIATEHSGVDLDRVSYFRLQNNVFNPTSPVPHANYEGVIVRRTVGNQTQASDIVGNSFVGVGYSDTTAYTETAVLLENANTVRVDHNTVYDMNVGVKGVAGSGNRIGPNNRYINVDTPEDVPKAMRTGEDSPECVFKASRNAATQVVPINTLTQVIFENILRDDKGYYNSTTGAFTPPAGHYRVRGRLRISDAVAGDFLGVYITVGGASVHLNGMQAAVAGLHVIEVNGSVEVDGTQAIAIAINVETGVGGANRTVFPQEVATRFEVEAITG